MNIIDRPSPNFNERAGAEIRYIILHYTGMETAEAALDLLTDPKSELSAHYTVDEDGTLYQHVAEDKRAWHAGVSAWRDDLENLNSQSLGIEIVNPGHTLGYRPFKPQQIETVIKLCQEMKTRHPTIEYVLAHSDIAPDRKQDPGELFPWKQFAQENIGVWPDVSDEDMVKASGLDVSQALKDFGYHAAKTQNMLLAFQQHYVPEAYVKKTQGVACALTKGRLYALLAGHLISPK